MKIKLPVTWEACGIVEVEAASIEEAIKNFIPDEVPTPRVSEYVDGSFRLTDTDPENVKQYQTN